MNGDEGGDHCSVNEAPAAFDHRRTRRFHYVSNGRLETLEVDGQLILVSYKDAEGAWHN